MEMNDTYEKIIEGIIENNYAIIDNFFDDNTIEILREGLKKTYASSSFKKAAIGNQSSLQIKDEIRGDHIFWLEEKGNDLASKMYFDKINELINYLNATCYLGIRDKEFHFAIYPKGTFYKRHLDTFQNDSKRKLSVVCYLNQENWLPEYGGALVIYKNDESITIYPEKGRMVIFESQLLEHEVLPVNQERWSITGWLKN